MKLDGDRPSWVYVCMRLQGVRRIVDDLCLREQTLDASSSSITEFLRAHGPLLQLHVKDPDFEPYQAVRRIKTKAHIRMIVCASPTATSQSPGVLVGVRSKKASIVRVGCGQHVYERFNSWASFAPTSDAGRPSTSTCFSSPRSTNSESANGSMWRLVRCTHQSAQISWRECPLPA